MFKWMAIGMIIIGLGVLMLVLNKNFDFGKLFGLISSLLLIGGIVCAAFGLFSAIFKNAALAVGGGTKQLPQAEEKVLPASTFPDTLPSVTERTTQLIEHSREKQKTES
jgi:hypothetical protein